MVILAAIAKEAAKTGKKTKRGQDRYLAKPLLSENEKKWYRTIKEAAPHVEIFGQVAMNQLLTGAGEQRWSAQGKIRPRSIDFVLLNADLEVVLAIEIDDRSHERPGRKLEDATKSWALECAEIPLLRIKATPILPSEVVKRMIVETLAAKAREKAAAKAAPVRTKNN